MSRSSIEWLARPGTIPESWNPVTGCTPISLACQNCYAARMAKRLKAMGMQKYRNGFKVTLHPEELDRPYRWRKRRTVFVCSMSDLFHEDVPSGYIHDVFGVMEDRADHTFIVLTKRVERMAATAVRWPPNVWAGVTVEHPDYLDRLNQLRWVPAVVRFVSFEPLLGRWPPEVSTLHGIDWVIAGAETGPGRRLMHADAPHSIRFSAENAGIPFFFKKNNVGTRLLGGRLYEEWPR